MPVVPLALARSLRVGLATFLAAGAALLGGAASPAAAAPGDCAPVDIYFSSASPVGLYRYSPYTKQVSSLPLDDTFLDITFSPDGSRLYGLLGGSLAEIDPQTGRTVDTISISGLGGGNALAQLADGRLIAANGSQLYDIDLETQSATLDPRSLPQGYSSSGDLLVLPGGDLLVVANQPAGGNALVRISPQGGTTVLGTVPASYGISASGDSLYLTSINGTIYRLDDLPDTAGDDEIPVVEVRQTQTTPYGATSINESKPCNAAFSASVSDDSVPFHQPPDLIAYGYPAGTDGTVTFRTGDTELCTAEVTGPETRCTSKDLPPGHHLVTATLSDAGSGTTQVATTSYDVERLATTIRARARPSRFLIGGTTTLSVRGLPPDATGTISFGNGDLGFCDVALPATSCKTSTDLRAGTYIVSASYSGDDTYGPSFAETSFEVRKKPTDLEVEPEQVTVPLGTPDQLMATGLPEDATGTVRFVSGDEELCEITLPDELSCTTSDDLAVGTYRVTATYSGDDTYLGSTATTVFAVTPAADPGPVPTATAPATAAATSSSSTAASSTSPSTAGTTRNLASTGGPPAVALLAGVVALLVGAVLLRRRPGSRT